ncbi:MAG: metallophosphoesterase [Cytophagaceae bacterium]
MLSTSQIFLAAFLLLIAVIIYYIANSKKRRTAFYQKDSKGWEGIKPREEQKIAFTIFLIGDAGAGSPLKTEPNFVIMREQLLKADENSAVFFLGDNIYPYGLQEPGHPLYKQSEERLLEQLKMVGGFKGRVCFISGNHDWNKGREGGYEAMMRQQAYIEKYFAREDVFLPRNGCPGPEEVKLSEEITAVVINTQWWVQRGKRPEGKKDGCKVENEEEFFSELEKILVKNKDKKLIVIGHHPMYSQAYHGGHFNMKQHLFPLTEVGHKLYIPFPLLGSMYPMYRKFIGAREDMAHPLYKNMRKRLVGIFSRYDNLIYAAGHDHNLQYLKEHNQHYIISGAGCKINYVKHGEGAQFTHAHKGFFRLDYFTNGDIWLEAWEPDEREKAVLAYRKELHDND